MKKSLWLIYVGCCALVFTGCSGDDLLIKSPDGKLAAQFNLSAQEAEAQYSIYYEQKKLIDTSSMGLALKEGVVLGRDVVIGSIERSSFSGSWKPVYGERDEYPDHYNQAVITLKDSKTGQPSLLITFRCYNEGVAFRYTVPSADSAHITTISRELTGFSFTDSVTTWVSHLTQDPIYKMPLSSINGAVERPLLVEVDTTTYLALGEAAAVDFARMKFSRDTKKEHTLTAALAGEVKKQGTFSTPWRYIMAARSPGVLLENNYLLLNLNEPNQIANTSWIKPGKVIRDMTLSTKGGMAYVDFAAKHNMQYIELDGGWYGDALDDAADATRVPDSTVWNMYRGPGEAKVIIPLDLDLNKVIQYADSKGIGVILYVDRRHLERQLDTILPLYQSWGVKGVKFGFVNVGTQQANTWLMEAVRKAAKYELMLDIHDEYRPTGFSRTYPNLLTVEGIRGDEESVKNDMVLNTLFTRMIAGAADQTNCYFAPRIPKMGSHTSQLAKTICIYSPFQFLFWCDRPESLQPEAAKSKDLNGIIRETPELSFFDRLPTVWNETKVLSGYPGEHIAMARRNGEDWFIGCLTGKQGREFEIDLSFLPKGKQYEAVIYYDDPTQETLTKVGISKIMVNSESVIKREVLAQNGLAICLSPKLATGRDSAGNRIQ